MCFQDVDLAWEFFSAVLYLFRSHRDGTPTFVGEPIRLEVHRPTSDQTIWGLLSKPRRVCACLRVRKHDLTGKQ